MSEEFHLGSGETADDQGENHSEGKGKENWQEYCI